MRIIGADIPGGWQVAAAGPCTLAVLHEDGGAGELVRVGTLPEVAARVARIAAGEPFLLGVNVPVVVPAKAARTRAVEGLVRRRFGFKLPAGGRAALAGGPQGVVGEALMAGLAAAGQPVLPYPDRDRRRPGLLETYPELILKALLWERSGFGASRDDDERQALLKAYAAPPYRVERLPARSSWTDQAVALDVVLGLLERIDGLDLGLVRAGLDEADSSEKVERAASALDATLVAALARRYLESPESCLFVGDREGGYVVLPADDFVRGLGSEARRAPGRLFPQGSLRERLGAKVRLRAAELLDLPGRPHRLEASFDEPPAYEFDNVDEMLWWKHTRLVTGRMVPVEGLTELVVGLDGAGADLDGAPLRLVRSRHPTLSFRFEPPATWRTRVPTRDGKTYGFRILRATYETL